MRYIFLFTILCLINCCCKKDEEPYVIQTDSMGILNNSSDSNLVIASLLLPSDISSSGRDSFYIHTFGYIPKIDKNHILKVYLYSNPLPKTSIPKIKIISDIEIDFFVYNRDNSGTDRQDIIPMSKNVVREIEQVYDRNSELYGILIATKDSCVYKTNFYLKRTQ